LILLCGVPQAETLAIYGVLHDSLFVFSIQVHAVGVVYVKFALPSAGLVCYIPEAMIDLIKNRFGKLILTVGAAALLAVASAQSVTVRTGDTLSSIAKRNGVSVTQLRNANGLSSDKIRIGQVLQIGSSSTSSSSTRVSSGVERPLWPVSGVMTQRFSYRGPKNGHAGLDLAAPSGTPVYAALSGTVTFSGWNVYGYGQLITIRGIDGRDYYYAHNSARMVSRGQRVRQGQLISRVGNTGNSTGPHLHFEIRSGSRILNPLGILPSSRSRLASSR
jgi:murein DD-endopeptidase MepM/ murein hydrolase activator NlpD